MRKYAGLALILIAAGGMGFYLYSRQVEDGRWTAPRPVGADRVEISLPDLEGRQRQLSEWNGKALLVNFWATWCAPCRREIPLLKKTQAEHGADNVQVIGIAVDFLDQVTAYAAEAEFNYPVLVGQEDAMAAAEATGIDFVGLPFTMVISSDGYLIKTHLGEIVEEHVSQILAVLERMRRGELDLAGARSALKSL